MLRQSVQRTSSALMALQSQQSRGFFGGNGLANVKNVYQEHSHHDASQVTYWMYAAFFGAFVCVSYTAYLYQAGAFHHVIDYDSLPKYPYLRIRQKSYPWGDCGLLERSSNCIPYTKHEDGHH